LGLIALALPLAVLTLNAAELDAGGPAIPRRPMRADNEALDYLDAFETRLERVAGHGRMVGFAAAILENGEPVAIYTSGETALGSGEAVTADTLFRAASVTKTFTGTMLAQLEDAELINLDAAVPPDLLQLKDARQPTWRELASHQTGLPPNAYDNLVEAGRDAELVRARLAEVDLLCQPGECYTYQNVAFDAVHALIEDATGLSYEDAVTTYLLRPLGLETAGFGAEHMQSVRQLGAPALRQPPPPGRGGDRL
jgi:beta-lactamase class C